ncbi:hypothetical protein ACTFIW_006061 [Dictyostelium discoideum]
MLLYCRKYLLFILKEKSEMLKTEVDLLGFHIHKDGISPRAAKVRATSELPGPRNAKEAEAVLGLFGFFRRHSISFLSISSAERLLYALYALFHISLRALLRRQSCIHSSISFIFLYDQIEQFA